MRTLLRPQSVGSWAVAPCARIPRRALVWAVLVGYGGIAAPAAAAQSRGATELRVVQPAGSRAGSRELVLELGPFDLPARAGHDGMRQPPPRAVALPVAGWIQGYAVEIIDARGSRLPQGMLHHVNVIVPGRRELFSAIMQRLAAAGAETAPVRLPRFIGYPVRRGDTLIITTMLHNPTGTAYTGARLRLRFPFTPATARFQRITIHPFYIDVMPPAGRHFFDLPPGRSARSWEARPAVPGRILGVSGHLHRYGVALRLEDVTAGRVIWEARPITDARGGIVGMPSKRFVATLGVAVRPDHVYRLTAVYDNPTGRTIAAGGMGALGGVFLPSRGVRWPPARRTDPEYQRDVSVTWRLTEQAAAGHGHH
jgi:hypothetical protein